MALQLFKIASYEVENKGASVVFSSIPQGYTDLMVKVSAADSSGNQTIHFIINNDSASNYSERILRAYAAANVMSQVSLSRANIFSYSMGDTPTVGAKIYNNMEIYIPNYTSANYKSISVDGAVDSNTSTVNEASLIAGLWSSTAAITSLIFKFFRVADLPR